MKSVFLEKCNQGLITHEPNLIGTILVSARTGYNIEKLIDKIYGSWRETRRDPGADIYLVGTTNVGKSSIFNSLLESDLCKIKAVDRVEKAMTSPVPGTTLNLLKFPIMRPDPARLNLRHQRLTQTMATFEREEEKRLALLRSTREAQYAVLRGPIERTFGEFRPDKVLPLAGGSFELQTRAPKIKLPERLDPMAQDFAKGFWLYDTPGTVCEDQLIHLLTQEEVTRLLPDLPVRPRSFVMKNGQSLFIAGLARVDLVSGPYFVHPLLVTVFASHNLPINIVRTENAEEFYEEAVKADFLEVPTGDPVRLRDFPPLVDKEFEVDGVDKSQSSCDLVLSSAGWVCFTPDVGRICHVRAWTPGGRGIYLRDPPFLPFASILRGQRLPGKPAYLNNRVFVPYGDYDN
jgi:ribosome biogenesis GTPase A